jgi:hypothetical protein
MTYLHTKYHKARQKNKKGTDNSNLPNNASKYYIQHTYNISILYKKEHIATVIVKDRKIRKFKFG